MPALNVNSSAASTTKSNRRKTANNLPKHQQTTTLSDPAATAAPSAVQGQYDAADAAMYKEMRAALAHFESQHRSDNVTGCSEASYGTTQRQDSKPHPRHKAFYAALRSVLTQVLEENTEHGRHTRLLAAHQWYVKHKPRSAPADIHMAAAMATSLSVVCPPSASTAAAAAAAQCAADSRERALTRTVCSTSASNQQQPADDGGAVSSSSSSRAARWLQQQQRLDDMQDLMQLESLLAATSTGANNDQQQQCHHYHQQQQQQHRIGSSAGSCDWANDVGRCSITQPYGVAGVNATADSLDGLIPLGSLPSCRFPFNSMSNSGSNTGCRHSSYSSSTGGNSSSYAASRALWQLVAGAQQQVEAAVATELAGYNRYRARVEEEICRKQEADMHMAGQKKIFNTLYEDGGAMIDAQGSNSCQRRALKHLDSQHQPSQVSASYQWVKSNVLELVPVDRIKEAKKQYLQDSAREVTEVAGQLADLGLAANPADLQRALMPIPDQAYMVCLARLPKPGLVQMDSTGTSHVKSKQRKKAGKKAEQKGVNAVPKADKG